MNYSDQRNDVLRYCVGFVTGLGVGLILTRQIILYSGADSFTVASLFETKGIILCSSSVIIGFLIIGLLFAHISVLVIRTKKAEELADSLKQEDVIKTKFLVFAAHNLRTPATAFKWSLSDLLKDKNFTPDQNINLNKLYSTSLALLSLIEDFLDVSKLELHQFEISLKTVPLKKLTEEISRIIEKHAPIAKEKDLAVKTLFTVQEDSKIQIDLSRVSRIVENLLENSINYSLPNGNVSISLESEKDFIRFSITDTGIGIPDVEKGHIFEEFFRSVNAKKYRSTGSGIGLFLAKKLVEAHGGKIWFFSKEGDGSTFIFTLPMIDHSKREMEEVFKRL